MGTLRNTTPDQILTRYNFPIIGSLFRINRNVNWNQRIVRTTVNQAQDVVREDRQQGTISSRQCSTSKSRRHVNLPV